MVVGGLGGRDAAVAYDVLAAEVAQERHDRARGVAGVVQEAVGDDEGSGVHERVAGSPGMQLELGDRAVAGVGGPPADVVPGGGVLAQQGAEREELGDALQRVRRLRVADADLGAVEEGHGEPEPVGVDLSELGDLGGDPAGDGGLTTAGGRGVRVLLEELVGRTDGPVAGCHAARCHPRFLPSVRRAERRAALRTSQ